MECLIPFFGTQKAKLRIWIEGHSEIRGKRYFKVVQVLEGIPGAETEVNYLRPTDRGIYKTDGKLIDSEE